MTHSAVRSYFVLTSLVSLALLHLLWTAEAGQAVAIDAQVLDTFVARNIGPAPANKGDKDQKIDGDKGLGDKKDKDSIALQGGWKVLSAEQDGKPLPDLKDAMVVITGDTFTMTPKGAAAKPAVKIKLDGTQKPCWFDIDIGPGIYFLEEDTLKLCFGKEGRPTNFTSQPARHLLILEREICLELP